ncbi:MAG: serine hydrolase [Bacteroidota bacterium]
MKALIPIGLILALICFSGLSYFPSASNATQSDLPAMSLEEAGFNQDSINRLLKDLRNAKRKDFRGLVVLKDNQIVLEEYYHTYWRQTIHDIRSAGKSITALLLGVAIKEGLIKDLDQNVYDLFASENAQIDENYRNITLRHLLDMASGLDADSDNNRTLGHAGKWMGMNDWKEYLLNVPRKRAPGKKFVYADIHAVLIGLAIEEASGMSLRDYAQKKLFDPLDIKQVYWYTNEANQTGGAGNLYLGALDFAKLGLLITNQGKWQGQQLIEASYINRLINHKAFEISNYFNIADSYGMLWYKSTRRFGQREFDYLFASGNGGNHLIIIPSENMVIALTSSAYGPGYGQGRTYYIMSRLLAALEK